MGTDILASVHALVIGDTRTTGYATKLMTDFGASTVVVGGLGPSHISLTSPGSPQRDVVRGALWAHLTAGADFLLMECSAAVAAGDLIEHVAARWGGRAPDLVIADIDWLTAIDAPLRMEDLRERWPRGAIVRLAHGELLTEDRSVPSTGLEACAAGGASWAIGSPGREPLSLPFELPSYQLALNGVAMGLAATVASRAGLGGVSSSTTSSEVLGWYTDMNAIARGCGVPFYREGARAAGSAGVYPYGLFPCADGKVALIARSTREWHAILRSVQLDHLASDEAMSNPATVASTFADEADEHLHRALARYTREELVQLGQEFGYAVAPMNTMGDVLAEPHFRERGAVRAVEVQGGRTLDLPGCPYTATKPATSHGNGSVADPHPAVDSPDGEFAADSRRPLEGVTVLDLSWVWAGPLATSILGDLGAHVIKVEHSARPDMHRIARLLGPPEWRRSSLDASPFYTNINRGKSSVALDLRSQKGHDVLLRMAVESDVIVENMRAGSLDNLGLSSERLLEVNPRLVIASMPGAGSTGRLRNLRAYAPIISSITGLDSLIGYRDDPAPIGMMSVGLGDPNAAIHTVVAVLAGLLDRDVSGTGVHVELSQTEALLSLLAEPMISHQLDGQPAGPSGNEQADCLLRGIFPTFEEDAWVSMSLPDVATWRQLARLVDMTRAHAQQSNGEIASGEGRLLDVDLEDQGMRAGVRDRVEDSLRRWTGGYLRDQLLHLLRVHGIPAAPVLSPDELVQKDVSGFDVRQLVNQPGLGLHPAHKLPWRFGGRGFTESRPAPLFGENSISILRELLGASDAQIDEWISEEVLR